MSRKLSLHNNRKETYTAFSYTTDFVKHDFKSEDEAWIYIGNLSCSICKSMFKAEDLPDSPCSAEYDVMKTEEYLNL